jgi:hypothetical protein
VRSRQIAGPQFGGQFCPIDGVARMPTSRTKSPLTIVYKYYVRIWKLHLNLRNNKTCTFSFPDWLAIQFLRPSVHQDCCSNLHDFSPLFPVAIEQSAGIMPKNQHK